MARYQFKMQRLFVTHPLVAEGELPLDKAQSNYLVNVLRMNKDDQLIVFNGVDGEWQVSLDHASKKSAVLKVGDNLRPQPPVSNLDYCFAPLKQARLDYMVQKAVEMGVGRLRPVFTDHTQGKRVNLERMMANVIEAAEQCGILSIPEVLPPVPLSRLLDEWQENDPERALVFCDEGDLRDDPATLLKRLEDRSLALLIGPEGGFSQEERERLNELDFVQPIPLGPRILRADTAAVAALALIQSVLGDWLPGRNK